MAIVEKLLSFMGVRAPARPFAEQGTGGTAIYGGYIEDGETNPNLLGTQRWRTASDLLANISIIAASVRLILNLVARPSWIVEPADESRAAQEIAEFVESILYDCNTPWPRIVRRSAMYRFHGFGFSEWIAKRRDDGRIGFLDVQSRPQHTIERWDIDPKFGLRGVVQRGPQDGKEYYLPRRKLIYCVDDALTDSPRGMGWFRHLVDPAHRLKEYLQLEGQGFERDLRGIPIGRAPINRIRQMVKNGQMTREDGDALLKGMRDFLQLQRRKPNTSALLDSQPYEGKTADGMTVSPVMQWGIELLTGEQTSIDKLGEAIRRLEFDCALIMGTENMLTGREGAGSLALSEDKSRTLFLNINSTLTDMADAVADDGLDPIMAMNGIPEELRPVLKTEDAAFKDVEKISRTLRDMGAAGAILAPDDPAIDDVRDLLGVSRQPEMTPERMGMLMPNPGGEDEQDEGSGNPDDEGQGE